MTEEKEIILSFVELVSKLCAGNSIYGRVETFLMQHGRFHVAAPLPSGVQRGMQGMCWRNAGRLVVADAWVPGLVPGVGRLRFADGLALRPGLVPIRHGWCVDDDLRVVDPTWGRSGGVHLLRGGGSDGCVPEDDSTQRVLEHSRVAISPQRGVHGQLRRPVAGST